MFDIDLMSDMILFLICCLLIDFMLNFIDLFLLSILIVSLFVFELSGRSFACLFLMV